jgi:hypothetical protein
MSREAPIMRYFQEAVRQGDQAHFRGRLTLVLVVAGWGTPRALPRGAAPIRTGHDCRPSCG